MVFIKRYSLGLVAVFFSGLCLAQASSTENKLQTVEERQNPNTGVAFEQVGANVTQSLNWSEQYLPILGAEARERGYVLPLPLGVSYNYVSLSEPLQIRGLKFHNTGTSIAIPTGLVDLDMVDVVNQNFRFDAWLLPFLNVYLLLGETRGDVDVTINTPPALTNPVKIPSFCGGGIPCIIDFPGLSPSYTINTEFEGETYGVGTTIAGGYGDFFGVLDVNYTESDIDILADKATATVYSARLGWNGNILEKFNGAFWLGGLKQDVKQSVRLPLSQLVSGSTGSILVDVESDAGTTPIAGVRWDITRDYNLMLEYGWHDRDFLLLSAGYRF